MAFKAPSERGIRKLTDMGKKNGPVVNAPKMAELGGLSRPGKMPTSQPGKVIKAGK